MEGVVPRRRDCLGESRVLEGGRSISPRGGGGGRRGRGSRGSRKDDVAEFTFLRYTVGSVMGSGAASMGTRRAMRMLLIYTRRG